MTKTFVVQVLAVVLTVILLDQFTKWWWQTRQTVTFNQDVAWSIPIALPPLVLTLALTAVVFLLAVGLRRFWSQHLILTGLFFGAALSNLIDRWWFGAVRDWLQWPIIGVTGNLADLALTLAVLTIIWREIKSVA